MKTVRIPIDGFLGLQNVSDPLSLDARWLQRADNCLITDRRKLVRAGGFTERATVASAGTYATEDQQRLYIAAGGSLRQVQADLSFLMLATLASTAPMRFAEVNGVVYYANGTDYGALYPNGRRPWGIPSPAQPNVTLQSGSLPKGKYQVCLTFMDQWGMESSNSPVMDLDAPDGSALAIRNIEQRDQCITCVYATASNDQVFRRVAETLGTNYVWGSLPNTMGIEIGPMNCNPPHGVIPAVHGGRIYLADPYPTLDVTPIWCSFPLHYHLFDDGSQGMNVPGTVLMQAACDGAVIVGTERGIYAVDVDAERQVTMLAPYGVVPGDHAKIYKGKLYFASLRGVCRALPFENLTEGTYSFAPGTSAAAAIVEEKGYVRYAMSLRVGGTAYNAY